MSLRYKGKIDVSVIGDVRGPSFRSQEYWVITDVIYDEDLDVSFVTFECLQTALERELSNE